MDEQRRNRHLDKTAAQLSADDAERFEALVAELRYRFARGDYRSSETYNLSVEFERLCAKAQRNARAQKVTA